MLRVLEQRGGGCGPAVVSGVEALVERERRWRGLGVEDG